MSEIDRSKFKVTRLEPEDPDDVRDRDKAHIEKYVGEDWAKGAGKSKRGRLDPE